MSDSAPINPDMPEFRLICQLAGIKPSAFAAALKNPEHFSKHISREEFERYKDGVDHLLELLKRVNAILAVVFAAELKKLKAKGLLTNAR